MAVGNITAYENGILNLNDGTTDFLTDTIKAALVLAAYTPDVAVHDFWDDVVANECADADYTTGGIALTTKALTIAANKVKFDAAEVDFGPSPVTITAKYMVVYHSTGVNSTSALLWYVDLDDTGGSVSSTASDFKVDFSTSGIYLLTP